MCWTMIIAKDYKVALEYLDEAIEIEPNMVSLYFMQYGVIMNERIMRKQNAGLMKIRI